MKNKLMALLLALCCLTLPLLSCAEQKETERETEDGGVHFTDALGREVTVQNPKRVAALIGSFADLWVLAGGTLCAAADDAVEDFGLDPEGLTLLGGAHSPSAEALLAAKPDLVLASASTASNVELKDILEQAGICVAYFDVDCFDDYLNMLEICTRITGRADLYEKHGLALKKEIEQLQASFQEKELKDEEKSVLVLRISSGLVKAKSSEGTILGEMLSELGCINIADTDKALTDALNIEYIIEKNPHHILVVTMGDEEKAKANFQTMMEENPAWSSLEAVKEGRMHILDKKLFNQKPNAQWAKAYETLSKLLQS